MNKHIILFGTAATMLLSCAREAPVEDINSLQTLTFTAGWAESEDTRTILQADGTSVWWDAGEQISLFFSNKASGVFTSTNTQPQAIVDFQGNLPIAVGSVESDNPAHAFWAVYPHDAANSCDGESVTLTVPAAQTATEGSFANRMFPSVSTSTNFHLPFYNVCGGARFSVANEGILSVTFKANGNEPLAGKVKVSFDADGKPEVKSVIEGNPEVTVYAPAGGFIPGTYYFASILPQTLSDGMTMTFKTDRKLASVPIDRSITIHRARFGRMDAKDQDLEFDYDYGEHQASDPILFADNTVKEKLVTAFDTDSDGNLSYKEAASVTSGEALKAALGSALACRSFDEFQYFFGITEIPESLFEDWTSLTCITLPPYVTSVGDYAFWECNSLSSITLPEMLEHIGSQAFEHCTSLTAITIPESVTSLGTAPFSGCCSIRSFSGKYASADGLLLTDQGRLIATASAAIEGRFSIPEGITAIGLSAFANCSGLVSVSIPESVKDIEAYAFLHCTSLASITVWAPNPPALSPFAVFNDTNNCPIYVPNRSVEAYREASGWVDYAARIHASSPAPEAVDLGLSVKWASFNVGATKPEEFGDYFAWGEVEPYYSSLDPLAWKEGKEGGYDSPSYQWATPDDKLTKYCTNPRFGYQGFTDGKTVLDPEDDAATFAFGRHWRMPTKEEFNELLENCTDNPATVNGVPGCRFTSNINGNSVFFPISGYFVETWREEVNTSAFYWSSTVTSYYCNAECLALGAAGSTYQSYVDRQLGSSVRPVLNE